MHGVAVLAIVVGLLAAAPAAQQGPPGRGTPQFRTGVEVVEVDVSVPDAKRRPVRGLAASDSVLVIDDAQLRPLPLHTQNVKALARAVVDRLGVLPESGTTYPK